MSPALMLIEAAELISGMVRVSGIAVSAPGDTNSNTAAMDAINVLADKYTYFVINPPGQTVGIPTVGEMLSRLTRETKHSSKITNNFFSVCWAPHAAASLRNDV
jgi:hypothetical protein